MPFLKGENANFQGCVSINFIDLHKHFWTACSCIPALLKGMSWCWLVGSGLGWCYVIYSFQNNILLDYSKLKEFTDDNFKVDENGIKLYKWVENTGKRRNCSLQGISPFPTVFSEDMYCRDVKTRACLGKG